MNELFATIFETFLFIDSFSDAVFESGIYSSIGITMVISSLVLFLLFYYGINSPKFNQWYHWLLVLVINFVINLLVTFFWTKSALEFQGLDFSSEYLSLALVVALMSAILYTLLSFSLRWWSANCSNSPISFR